jgi:hypothetical protein
MEFLFVLNFTFSVGRNIPWQSRHSWPQYACRLPSFTKSELAIPSHTSFEQPLQNIKTRSIGLWQCYINITITILDIIHRPVFYLKLNSTLQVCLYLAGNTLRLRYKPNRLMLSIGLWQWYINITITILDKVKVKVKVTLRPTYESASPSWRQEPIWDPWPN